MNKVLIIAREELVAALLGLMVETHGLHPQFADTSEPVKDTLRRNRFKAVVIDCDYPDCNEELLEAVMRAGAQPVFFSALGMSSQQQEVASRFDLPAFTSLTEPAEFGRVLLES